jgi:hypothetical protein
VYLGTDYNNVNAAADPNLLPGRGNQTARTFNPGILDYNTTYYWRIDEIDGNTTTTGNLWSFTVRPVYQSAYSTIHVPGDGSELDTWDPAGANNAMKLIADYTWRLEVPFATAKTLGYKFAMDGKWVINRGLGSTSGRNLPQDNSSLTQDGENIIANFPRGICIWEYYENTETSRLYTIDFNADGVVNLADLRVLALAWLQNQRSVDIAPLGGDGIVNFLDFAVFAQNWLTSTP